MKRTYYVLVALLIGMISNSSCTRPNNGLFGTLKLAGLDSASFAFAQNWPLVENLTGENVIYLNARSSGPLPSQLFLNSSLAVTMELATKKMIDAKSRIMSLYDPKPDPYFAVLTKKIDCPLEFWPKEEHLDAEKSTLLTFKIFASERLGLGACDTSSAKYQATIAYLYCKKTGTYSEIKLFTNNSNSSEIKFQPTCL